MTDPRQTSRDSATSARSKVFGIGGIVRASHMEGDVHVLDDVDVKEVSVSRGHIAGLGPGFPPVEPKRRLVTGHGIGWLVQLLVGLATLYLIVRGTR